MSYAALFSDGSMRLYASREAAERDEARRSAGSVAGGTVNGRDHWRGRVPARGVLYTREDVSFHKMMGMLSWGG